MATTQHVARRTRLKRVHPSSDRETISLYAHRSGACTMDENLTQIDVATLADAE
jgi:hypothetical protein